MDTFKMRSILFAAIICSELVFCQETNNEHFDDSQCSCPNVHDPVCGSDRVTYINGCHAQCHGVKYNNGPCVLDCNFKNNPISNVCGIDGNTYLNMCEAESQSVPISCYKSCPCDHNGASSANSIWSVTLLSGVMVFFRHLTM